MAYIRGKLKLVIDTSDSDTPAIVYYDGTRLSSTYDCALGTGFVDDEYQLSAAEIDWLEKFRDEVEEAFEIARKDDPNYG